MTNGGLDLNACLNAKVVQLLCPICYSKRIFRMPFKRRNTDASGEPDFITAPRILGNHLEGLSPFFIACSVRRTKTQLKESITAGHSLFKLYSNCFHLNALFHIMPL